MFTNDHLSGSICILWSSNSCYQWLYGLSCRNKLWNDTNADSDSDTNANANSRPDSRSYTNANPGSDSYANSNPNTGTRLSCHSLLHKRYYFLRTSFRQWLLG
jgi:hypothetical protein